MFRSGLNKHARYISISKWSVPELHCHNQAERILLSVRAVEIDYASTFHVARLIVSEAIRILVDAKILDM